MNDVYDSSFFRFFRLIGAIWTEIFLLLYLSLEEKKKEEEGVGYILF